MKSFCLSFSLVVEGMGFPCTLPFVVLVVWGSSLESRSKRMGQPYLFDPRGFSFSVLSFRWVFKGLGFPFPLICCWVFGMGLPLCSLMHCRLGALAFPIS